jgi:hypothetical protein
VVGGGGTEQVTRKRTMGELDSDNFIKEDDQLPLHNNQSKGSVRNRVDVRERAYCADSMG